MNTRRFVSLLLAALMLFAAIPALAEGEDRWGQIDMGGATITIAYNWDYIPQTTDYVYNPETDGPGVLEDLEAMKYVEAKYNCRIERINLDWNQRVSAITNSVMNNDPIADLVLLDLGQILPLTAQELLLPLNDFVPETADIFTDKQILVSGGQIMNKDYAINSAGAKTSGYVLGVNLDLVDELGLENPIELYENGEWTWDKMKEICISATKDTNGDGQNDTWGLSGAPYEIAFQLIAANDGFMASAADRKQGLDDPRTMEALNFFDTLYNVEKTAYIAGNNIDDWNGNRLAFAEGTSVLFLAQDWLLGNTPSFNFGIVPFPQGPQNESGKTFFWNVSGACVPKNVENPLWAYIVYEELTGYKSYEERSAGTVEWISGMLQTEEDVARMIDICSNQAKMDEAGGFANFPNYSMIWSIINAGKTPAQAVEEVKQVAQDAIDEFFRSIEE